MLSVTSSADSGGFGGALGPLVGSMRVIMLSVTSGDASAGGSGRRCASSGSDAGVGIATRTVRSGLELPRRCA